MKKELIVFYFLMVLLLPNKGFAQQDISFNNLTLEQGLSQNSVVSIGQDSHQFMWFGTRHGLNRYDGSQFKIYTSDPKNINSISNNIIESIFTDSKGILWLGTPSGLNKYDSKNDNFIRITTKDNGLSNDIVNCIYEDQDKNLWVGTDNGLNLMTNRERNIFKKFYFKDGGNKPGLNSIYSILRDKNGTIWIGSSSGLIKMNITKEGKTHAEVFRKTKKTGSISSNYIADIAKDHNDNLWIATDKGINLYNPMKRSFLNYSHQQGVANSLIHDDVREIIVHKNGSLWIGTQEGLSILDPKSKVFSNYRHNPDINTSLSQNSIHSMFQDLNGTMWIGSFYGGVDLVYPYPHAFHNYRASGFVSSINSNIVRAIVEDKHKNLWIGTEGGGLNYFDRTNHKYSYYRMIPGNPNAMPSNLVKSLFHDKNGKIFIGMHEGFISVFNPEKEHFEHIINTSDRLGNKGSADIMTILEDSRGTFWVGSRDGLNNIIRIPGGFAKKTVKSDLEKQLNSNYIQTIIEDSSQNIWIGTVKGLHLYNPATRKMSIFLKKEGDKDSLQSDYINCIIQTSKDQFCIGTYFGGISVFDIAHKKFKTYTETDGLSNNNVLGMIKDNNGNLWISTDNGLSKMNLKTGRFNTYTKSDGLAGNDFNMRSFLKTSKGEFFFGGYNGLTSFFPDQIDVNNIVSPITFTGLKLFNEFVQVNNANKMMKENIIYSPKLKFNYDHNNFTIGYALLNYIKPDKNKYYYKLDGYDKDWISTSLPYATYTNLPSGNYIFTVKGINNDGTPGGNPATIGINMLPPFWASWWAYLFYFFLFSSISFVTLRYFFVKAMLKKSENLQKMKLNFFTYVAHEIRTPLTLILGPIEHLLITSRNYPEINNQVIPLKNNADRLMRLVTELMDFRKAETGHLKLHVSMGDLVGFCHEIFIAFKDMAVSRNIEYSFTTDQESTELYFDKGQLEKVLFNLIANAFKFSNKDGKVELSIHQTNQEVEIKITDNGQGIPYDSQNKLFSDYFQVDEQESNHIGSGIGLALSKGIIEAHHGKIEIVSTPATLEQNGYTCFTIKLKKGKAHFKKEELLEVKEIPSQHKVYLQQDAPPIFVNKDKDVVKSNEMILIIEDNIEITQLLVDAIGSYYQIETCLNGLSGLKIAVELLPDLIICDVMMPLMDGLELCQKLKTDERTSHIPIILLTARSSYDHQLAGYETGADAYVTKPFSMALLNLNIKNLLAARDTMRKKFSQEINLQPQNVTINSTDHAFIDRIIKYIETHMADENFGVFDLAKEMGMSLPILYKKIRAMTDLSVNDFVKSIRLKRASQLLKQNVYTISEISYMVGFNDPKYFSREFKRAYGETPKTFSKSLN
ncbi:two-component regulator propeller domain-containing protein [Pedobacter frigoris]|uniref:hybrid sensor histidine kinase/response regulator transcription factor n=1 Tax=Pedobacter frigoris TaxID=2571272 RepID=UPI00292F0581|nr:two-component regulator propeller domain-containing protein [Pedobacter frigoris]